MDHAEFFPKINESNSSLSIPRFTKDFISVGHIFHRHEKLRENRCLDFLEAMGSKRTDGGYDLVAFCTSCSYPCKNYWISISRIEEEF
jgi:hypothetical protein